MNRLELKDATLISGAWWVQVPPLHRRGLSVDASNYKDSILLKPLRCRGGGEYAWWSSLGKATKHISAWWSSHGETMGTKVGALCRLWGESAAGTLQRGWLLCR